VRVLVVLVERDGPRHLLRRRVDLDGAGERAHGVEQLARDRADRPVGVSATRCARPSLCSTTRLVGVAGRARATSARAVGRRQRERLPAARGQAQRRVLELRLGRGERGRQLAEHLRVRVERVARRAPRLVVEGRPWGGHGRHATERGSSAGGAGLS
jgi:hypothetical protein